jgi:hypothetical protein
MRRGFKPLRGRRQPCSAAESASFAAAKLIGTAASTPFRKTETTA